MCILITFQIQTRSVIFRPISENGFFLDISKKSFESEREKNNDVASCIDIFTTK